jgi:formylmethanofuran dehydrogenase subunit E
MSDDSLFQKKSAKAHDRCALCEEEIPEDRLILKHSETGKIICLMCVIEFAKVS